MQDRSCAGGPSGSRNESLVPKFPDINLWNLIASRRMSASRGSSGGMQGGNELQEQETRGNGRIEGVFVPKSGFFGAKSGKNRGKSGTSVYSLDNRTIF
jgi:hypothetical protein